MLRGKQGTPQFGHNDSDVKEQKCFEYFVNASSSKQSSSLLRLAWKTDLLCPRKASGSEPIVAPGGGPGSPNIGVGWPWLLSAS